MEVNISELREAASLMETVGLKNGAQWARELLVGARETTKQEPSNVYSLQHLTPEDHDVIGLARSELANQQYENAAHLLTLRYGPDRSKYPEIPLFMWAYAMYLAGEKNREIAMAETEDPMEQQRLPAHPHAGTVHSELTTLYEEGSLSGLTLYIFANFLREVQQKEKAVEILEKAVGKMPLLWPAWVDLARLLPYDAEISDMNLPEVWTKELFHAYLLETNQRSDKALPMYRRYHSHFPNSHFLMARIAGCLYNLREFDKAQQAYESIRGVFPYSISGLENYSNILFIKGDSAALSYLAHAVFRVDKFSPEANCIVGNYYSLKGNHKKAVESFKRALHIDRRFLSAWTLPHSNNFLQLGHEFIELQEPGPAIECYRRAVELDPKDYRAWYGLGQTYELQQTPIYSLHYYRKAAVLRPYDGRIWCALGGCYEKIKRTKDAIACYKRARRHSKESDISTLQLARLLEQEKADADEVAGYYKEFAESQSSNEPSRDAAEAILYLVEYHLYRNRLEEAENLATRLLGWPFPQESHSARVFLREIRNRKRSEASQGNAPSEAIGLGIGMGLYPPDNSLSSRASSERSRAAGSATHDSVDRRSNANGCGNESKTDTAASFLLDMSPIPPANGGDGDEDDDESIMSIDSEEDD